MKFYNNQTLGDDDDFRFVRIQEASLLVSGWIVIYIMTPLINECVHGLWVRGALARKLTPIENAEDAVPSLKASICQKD